MAKEIIMPKFGFTQETGTVVAWLKGEGDYVEAGDPIMEVETDKVVMEVEAPMTGFLAGLRVAAGDEVPVTQIIAYIVKEGESVPEEAAAPAGLTAPPQTDAPASASPASTPNKATPVAERVARTEGVDLATVPGTGPEGRVTKRDVQAFLNAEVKPHPNGGKQRTTPAARRIARESGIVLKEVVGTGPKNRVQAGDVLKAMQAVAQQQDIPAVSASAPALAPASAPTSTPAHAEALTVRFNNMRRAIARNLQASWQTAPHIFFTADADLTAANALVQLANQQAPEGVKVTLTAVMLKVVAWALMRHPALNSHIGADEVIQYPHVHLGMAVALENGLVVPVIHHAEQMGIIGIAAEVARLGGAAKAGKLRPDDLSGGTFSVSNLGMYPVKQFTAIINPPQVGILAVGRGQQVFVPDDTGQPTLRPMVSLTLSVDHRAIDGAVAAAFLGEVVGALAQPEKTLL